MLLAILQSKENLLKIAIFFLVSFFIVSLGNPVYFPVLSFFAASIGYALFWRSVYFFQKKSHRFLYSSIWYTLVQGLSLSWMASLQFQGYYILFAYSGIVIWLGLQFGCLSFFLPDHPREIKPMRLLGIASFWTLVEWARLHILCGLSFHPSGMALTGSIFPMQMAAIWGILGLSFWVMLTNLAFLPCLFSFKGKKILFWASLAIFPYLFGLVHIAYHEKRKENSSQLNIALLQTGLLPSEKFPLHGRQKEFISPWVQWSKILQYLNEKKNEKWELIVLPETVVPFRFREAVYPLDVAVKILKENLSEEIEKYLPDLEIPYAEKKEQWLVSNAFWAKAIANYFQAEVIIGLDDKDPSNKKNYNAAFHFFPSNHSFERYEKQVLVPAEYLPFDFLKPVMKCYGIAEFFTPGSGPKVFSGTVPLCVSICYEETYSDIIREGRKQGAKLFVNLSNDGWYPGSSLPLHHFEQGRLRAIENGVPLLRSCNTGVTAAVDSLGKILARLGDKTGFWERKGGALIAKVPLYHYKTLFSFWGDGGIISLSVLFFFSFIRFKKKFNW